MTSNEFPSEEDFARARASVSENDRGLSEVRSRIMQRFQGSGLHEVFVFYSSRSDKFVAHLFYRHTDQIKVAEKSGLSSKIKDAVFEELENVGRGGRESIDLEFNLDSHENVLANFEGDYFLRLR